MKSPYSNPYLSARAKGIFAFYSELGRPVSADEMSAVMPEGRDAIQAAINELRRAGYIRTTREWNGTKWISVMKFTKEAIMSNPKVLNTGFSGLLFDYSNTTNSKPIVEVLRTSTITRTASSNEEGAEMPWNLDGEEEKPAKVRGEVDEAPGSVGKIQDKVAMRKAKYGGKGLSTASVDHRSNKPEEEWNTKDLVSEFSSLLNNSSAGHLTMQLNTQQLAIWINKAVGNGSTRLHILAAIRMFFEDPRNLNGAGVGAPLWRKFIGFYQSVEGKTLTEEKVVYEDEAFLAHQEKMLKLLGGGK